MTDLRAAAERLRECAEAIVSGVVKEVTPNSTSYAVTENCRIGLMEAYELATAYLADHPADSDTPIDANWLRSVGFTRFMQPANENSLSLEKLILRRYQKETGWNVYIDGTHWALKTRGDVRALARCLGITLKE